jgi:hypothetical protein
MFLYSKQPFFFSFLSKETGDTQLFGGCGEAHETAITKKNCNNNRKKGNLQ